jgi:signal transduction histidine kinase
MKLLNHTLLYLSVSLLAILSLWSVFYYFITLEEVKDSIDDSLDNYKMLIIYKAQGDSSLLEPGQPAERNYLIREILPEQAAQVRDTYKDTQIYIRRNETFETRRLLTTAFPAANEKFYELKVMSAMMNRGELIKKLLFSLVGLYFFILASMLIVNHFVLQKIWQPFYSVLQQLRSFKLGTAPPPPLPDVKIKEFQVLNETVSALLMSNQETYNSQKQFIENAAHELQTPLAISINKLELLADKPTQTEEDVQAIAQIIETLEGLTRLNKSLLLLSKIENRQFPEEKNIDFGAVFERMMEAFADLAAFRKIELTLVREGAWACSMNADLADILAINLLKNAIIHNKPGGKVLVTVSTTSFTVENTGEPSPMNTDRMFERFYKRSSEHNSTGLGLAIVKAIANFYNLSIAYSYNGRHVLRVGV